MRAVVYPAYGVVPELTEVPDPSAPDGGVVVDVRATGVCRSDWHAWMGHDPVALPHVPGHELAGTVAEIGAGVVCWRVGDRVTVPFVCGCGQCAWCVTGDAQVCPDQTQPGFTHWGSFADQVVLHAADLNLVALPDAVDDVAAASLGCRFATAYRALTAHGGLAAGQWLAVHGAGGVGLSAVLIGVALGARVVVTDPSPTARALALELGAEVVLDPAAGGTGADAAAALVASVVEATGGGAHVGVDAVGSAAVAVTSVSSLRRRGRHVQVGLLFGPDATPPLPMDRMVALELSVHGSHGMAARDYPAMLAMLASGQLDPGRLVTRLVGLDGAGAALRDLGESHTEAGMTIIRT
ncbi:MAG: alcohol dehydrogenase catalytic domain-containing protein [Lapillicoccus sp.]